jgi:hypothetical protein
MKQSKEDEKAINFDYNSKMFNMVKENGKFYFHNLIFHISDTVLSLASLLFMMICNKSVVG